ncbi:MAG: hypothetical protein AB7E55_08070 [Pigmentiphaga sp.]
MLTVANSGVIIAGSHDALEPAVRMPDGTVFDAKAFDVDFDSPSLIRNASVKTGTPIAVGAIPCFQGGHHGLAK